MKKTLFILGAGSSASYGFPTGADLKQLLIADSKAAFYKRLNCTPDESYLDERGVRDYFNLKENLFPHTSQRQYFEILETSDEIKREKIDKSSIALFQKKLDRSSNATIDTFVNNAPQFELISKIFVTIAILAFSKNIDSTDSNDDWITYLSQNYFDWKSDKLIIPDFISFNYDQLVRHKIENYFEIKDESISPEELSIRHVYGKVNSKQFWKEREKVKTILEGSSQLISYISKNTKNIDFMRGKGKQKFNLSQYKNIYILGYGFDKFNNKILFKNKENLNSLIEEPFITDYLTENKKIVPKIEGVSCYGLSEKMLTNIESELSEDSNSPFIREAKCLETLKNTFPVELFP